MFFKMGLPTPTPESTLFVDNLRENVSINLLWNLFHSFGNICHIRIARKKRVDLNRCFAFVEFHFQRDAEKAMSYLHGRLIERRKIIVEQAIPWKPKNRCSISAAPSASSSLRKNVSSAQRIAEEIESPLSKVAAHDSHIMPHSISLKASNLMVSKLERSIVLQSGNHLRFEQLKIKLSKWVRVDEIIPLSGDKVVVVLHSVEDRIKLLEKKAHWKIKAWDPSDQPNTRLVDIIIRGIPLMAWSTENIISIAQHLGKVIAIEGDKEASALAYSEAIVRIETNQFTLINETFTVLTNNIPTTVGVSEINNLQVFSSLSPTLSMEHVIGQDNKIVDEVENTRSSSLSRSVDCTNKDTNDSQTDHESSDALRCLGTLRLLEYGFPEDGPNNQVDSLNCLTCSPDQTLQEQLALSAHLAPENIDDAPGGVCDVSHEAHSVIGSDSHIELVNSEPNEAIDTVHVASNTSDHPTMILLPHEIPDSMQSYYDIGASLIGKDTADKITNKAAVACLGFGKRLKVHIPNPLLSIENLSKSLEGPRKSARVQGKKKNKENDPEISTSSLSDSLSLEF